MKIEYKKFSLLSEEDLKRAERLRHMGWEICSVGFTTLKLVKKTKKS
jgi:hypothetical protein